MWDQSAYSQQLLWPALALGRTPREASRVRVRVLSYACFCNTKWFFRHLLHEPSWRHHRPVSVHTNYHPEKQQRMQSIFDHYHAKGGGGGGGEGDWAALTRWSGTQGTRVACERTGGGAGMGTVAINPAELIELSSRGPWLFHNMPPRSPAALVAAPTLEGRAAAFAAVRFLPGGQLALGPPPTDARAAAAAPVGVRARATTLGAPDPGGSSWGEARGRLTLRLYGEEYGAFRRGRALVATRCADGLEVFARYEGHTCNATAWRKLRAAEQTRAAAARTLARGGKWRWLGRHDFRFHADGRLETPWHKGVWGMVPERSGTEYVFARFANIDHLLHVTSEDRMESVRCDDGDKVTVTRPQSR